MPELKNETPSDQELRDYFMEHFAFTIMGQMFASHTGGVSEKMRREGKALSHIGCERFVRRAGESLLPCSVSTNSPAPTRFGKTRTGVRPCINSMSSVTQC